jgi:hypothetical protein
MRSVACVAWGFDSYLQANKTAVPNKKETQPHRPVSVVNGFGDRRTATTRIQAAARFGLGKPPLCWNAGGSANVSRSAA